jgi:esterase/lipase
MSFDDTVVAYRWDHWYFTKPRYQEINRLETAVESGEPFLLLPEAGVNLGVVLVHGFLASPAEMRRFSEKLKALGYPVIGVRLKGHGTSPCDLRERSWQEWLESVRQGFSMISAFAERICLVGFSTGGALALKFAAEHPEGLAGVAGISVPLKFRSQKIRLVPLLHSANQFVRWVGSGKGVMPFHPNDSENPHINYRSIPIRGLYELRHLVEELQVSLPNIRCPVALLQGTEDPLIDPASAELIYDKLGSKEKTLTMIPSGRHAILYDDIGGTQEAIEAFLKALASDPSSRRPPKMLLPITVPAETCG